MSDGEIYEKHADDLVRFATGLVGPADAPDVVSSAVLNAISSRGWAEVREHRNYLFRAVVNEAHMQHRSRTRRRWREARVAVAQVNEPNWLAIEVQEFVDALSVRQRAVVVLTYWDDLHERDIARVLGISEGSVRRHLARAHTRLREMWRHE